jgi:hypothetical protein
MGRVQCGAVQPNPNSSRARNGGPPYPPFQYSCYFAVATAARSEGGTVSSAQDCVFSRYAFAMRFK